MSSVASIAGESREELVAAVPEISVLIHVVNPDANVDMLVRAYSQALDQLGRGYELLFILDGVTGRVLERLEELRSDRITVKTLALQGGGNGESIAYTAALQHTSGRYLITAVDYLQIDPRAVGPIVEALDAGSDLVTSWRWPRVDPLLNRLQSGFFNRFLRVVSQVDLHDLNCGFRGLRREVLDEITIYGDQFRFLPIMAAKRGYKIREVKVRHQEERGKTGFFGFGVYFRRLLDILAVTFLSRFTRKPLRFFGIIGLALLGVGLLLSAPPLLERMFSEHALQNRPIFLMGVVLISFGLQFIGFGLVGEIIIFTQSKNLRDYKVQRIVTSNPGFAAEVPVIEGEEVETKLAPSELSGELRIRHPAPGEDSLIDSFVESCPSGSFFHLSYWRKMVEEVTNQHGLLYLAERKGEIVGFLPVFDADSLFLGKVRISVPFAVYGGVVTEDPEVASALLAAASKDSDEAGRRYLELRQRYALELAKDDEGKELPESELYVGFSKVLPEDPEDCLKAIPKKARAEARKGRDRNGLVFEENFDLGLFHRLFATNKQHLGSPPMGLTMMRSIVRHLGERVVMHKVSLPDGRPIAAVMSFLYRDEILPYYSGSLTGFEKTGVNNFMYWRLMEWASERGIRRFDFGRSRQGTGAAAFKKNMGFEPFSLHYRYHLGEGGKLPDFHPGNPKLSIYKRIWRHVPGPIARCVGGRIFRELP